MDWTQLSDETLWTVAKIALPLSQGNSPADVAASLSLTLGRPITRAWLAKRMRDMRAEIADLTGAAIPGTARDTVPE